MPVKFLVPRPLSDRVRTGSKPSEALSARQTPTPAPKAPKSKPSASAGPMPQSERVGTFQILAQCIFDPPPSGTLFLVHTKKKGMWYQVLSHNADTGDLMLRSLAKTEFPSNTKMALASNLFVAVVGPLDAFPLPTNVLEHVQAVSLPE